MYRGTVIDDLIETVVGAEQQSNDPQSSIAKKARANVQAYAMYLNEYVRPQAPIHEVA